MHSEYYPEGLQHAPSTNLSIGGGAEATQWIPLAFAHMMRGYHYLPEFPLDVESELEKLGAIMSQTDFTSYNMGLPMSAKYNEQPARSMPFPVTILTSAPDGEDWDEIINAISKDDGYYDSEQNVTCLDVSNQLIAALTELDVKMTAAASASCHLLYTAILLAARKSLRSHRSKLEVHNSQNSWPLVDYNGQGSPQNDADMAQSDSGGPGA